jgi:hypothetical protein
MNPRNRNPHLSESTAAGDRDEVKMAWDRGNDQWWDWYMSLADSPVPRSAPLELAPWEPETLPTDEEVAAELSALYPLPEEAIAAFATEGFVKLPRVLSAGAAARLRARLRELLADAVDSRVGFQSLEMMWLTDPLVRAAVLSPRIGEICARLLDVVGVRLYHDNALSKQPGTGRTPWHYDAHHFPLATTSVVTAWAALQPTPTAMGPLAFARGKNAWRLIADIPFDKHGTSYDRRVAEAFRATGVAVEESPYAPGEVSFHHSLSVHTAGANRTTTARVALATTYFADGAHVVDRPTMVSGDWKTFLPGVEPGARAISERNPLVFALE